MPLNIIRDIRQAIEALEPEPPKPNLVAQIAIMLLIMAVGAGLWELAKHLFGAIK
jgi:hypothetical protein